MKKTIFYILPVLFIISGCYIYRPYSDEAADAQQGRAVSIMPQSASGAGSAKRSKSKAEQQESDQNIAATVGIQEGDKVSDMEMEEKSRQETRSSRTRPEAGSRAEAEKRKREAERAAAGGKGIKAKILAGNYYKITVEEREYKIQADQWEGDTLVSHILRKPKRVLKFHENQIDEELIKERIFSKPYSDVITVGSYAAGGAAILLLVL